MHVAPLPGRPGEDPSDDDNAAFTDLYTSHYGHVLAYAQRRTDQDSSARDVTAETFLIAWRRLEVALPGGLPWLYTTAGLVLANHHRTHRRAQATALRLMTSIGTANGQEATGEPDLPRLAHPDPATAHADQDEVRRAVRRLPDLDRELLLFTVWEHLDVATAASVIGCSTAAAHVRLHRARRKLRQMLTPAPLAADQSPSRRTAANDRQPLTAPSPTPPAPLPPRPERDR